MQSESLNIVMVEDEPAQALLMRAALKESRFSYQLDHATDLRAALPLVGPDTDVILLDLNLPDSHGIDTVRRMHRAAPDVPIVVLTGLNDEEIAIAAMREGAHDYLDKEQVSGRMLGRVIQYAVQRTRSERQIRQAHERFRLAASAAHEILYDWDLGENTVFQSDGLCRVLGCLPDATGPSMEWWIRRIHPEDVAAYRDLIDRALATDSTFLAEYRVQHQEGHYVSIWDRGLIVRNGSDDPVRVIGGRLDITERHRAEEELRRTNQTLQALIDACPMAIIALDREARVISWNSEAESMFGWKAEEALNRPLPTVPRELRDEFERLLANDLQGRSRRGVEARRVRRDGVVIDVSISTSPIRDHSGHIVAIMGVLDDITLRKKAQAERAALENQLHQTQKLEAVGQLAAGVAHDFNNLLTVILGNTDRLKKLIAGDDERSSVLGMIEEAARQATGVTRSLLTFSHKIPTLKQHMDLNAAVEEAGRLLERLLPKNIDLRVQLPQERIHVFGDRSQVQQIILNLAINARDAMHAGGRLVIRLSRSPAQQAPAAESLARIEVCDTGSGIPPELVQQIFDPFFTTKPRGQGTGLGLAIVRSIVEDHDGRVQVQSALGGGSRFIVELPASSPGREPEASFQDAAPVPRGDNQLVLLAEDNTYVREVVASALRSFGYRVLEAGDGAAALAAHEKQQGRIAAFIFDHDLPRRAGLLCIRDIRQRGDLNPAIITSGSVGVDFEDELEENTILLRKPFQMSELARVLAGALQVRESSS